MRLVERMQQHPPNCIHCGKGNVENAHGEIDPAVDLERDVNWGDSTYLCADCAQRIGMLVGMVYEGEVEDEKRKVARLEQQVHDLQAERDLHKRRAMAIAQGREAERETVALT